MRISTATSLVALSCLTFMTTMPFSGNGGAFVSAALTPEDRIEVEAKDPSNPNYCPACLKKAMTNHFPHACLKELDPMDATSRPEGPSDIEQRCVCLSFVDLSWMKADCTAECPFVRDPEAMQYFLSATSIPGCDKWVDFETNEERIVEGFPPKDPNYKPEVFTNEDSQAPQKASSQEEEVVKVVIEEDTTESSEPAESVEPVESVDSESIVQEQVVAVEVEEEARETFVPEDTQDVETEKTVESVDRETETDSAPPSVVAAEAELKIEETTEKVEAEEPAPLDSATVENTEAEANVPIADAQDEATAPKVSSNVKDEL